METSGEGTRHRSRGSTRLTLKASTDSQMVHPFTSPMMVRLQVSYSAKAVSFNKRSNGSTKTSALVMHNTSNKAHPPKQSRLSTVSKPSIAMAISVRACFLICPKT